MDIIRSKDIYLEQQIEDAQANDLYIAADRWEQERRLLAEHKPEPIGRRFHIFSRELRMRNRREKINSCFLPF